MKNENNYQELINDLKGLKKLYPNDQLRGKINDLTHEIGLTRSYTPKLVFAKAAFFIAVFSLFWGSSSYIASHKSEAAQIVTNIHKNLEKIETPFNKKPNNPVITESDQAIISATPTPAADQSSKNENDGKYDDQQNRTSEELADDSNNNGESASSGAENTINNVIEKVPSEASGVLNDVLGILDGQSNNKTDKKPEDKPETANPQNENAVAPTMAPINVNIQEVLPIKLKINIGF